MLKHIITTKCNRECEYCITKNLKVENKVWDVDKLNRLYSVLHENVMLNEIMITGGEPTMYKYFSRVVIVARHHFAKVYLTTQNPMFLLPYRTFGLLGYDAADTNFNAVTFSMHDKKALEYKNKQEKFPVYASILDSFYSPELPRKLKDNGFAGLTINEEQREGKEFTQQVPDIENFSIRINRKGKCMNEFIILPDLTVTADFKKYL